MSKLHNTGLSKIYDDFVNSRKNNQPTSLSPFQRGVTLFGAVREMRTERQEVAKKTGELVEQFINFDDREQQILNEDNNFAANPYTPRILVDLVMLDALVGGDAQ